MGLLRRTFGSDAGSSTPVTQREVAAETVAVDAQADGEQIVELDVVGESYRQDTLAGVAGPKEYDGKELFTGVTLRCEPTNKYDPNAVRVETVGQLVGFIGKEQAALLSAAMKHVCGGVLEARGLIVGGWDRGDGDVGSYGIRVWISTRKAEKLGIRPDDLDWKLRPKWPDIPTRGRGEARLGPTPADVDAGRGSVVTVTCEEHYQPTIGATMPNEWNPERTWPMLVELAIVDANPHTNHGTPCVEVRIDGDCVGYFTPKMTDRHRATIETAAARNDRVTAAGTVSRREKGGTMIWRVGVAMLTPD